MNAADIPQDFLSTDTTTHRTGTQSLARALKLARIVASRPVAGWRLSDLALASELDRATVHRMLNCMVEERLLVQRCTDRHYLPGPLMYELGLALPHHTRFQRCVEDAITPFARRMGGIVIFLLRSGNEFVCSARAGTGEITGAMVYAGARRPLITSAGGVAILQTLPNEEGRRVLGENMSQEIKRHGRTRLDGILKMLDHSDELGFGVNLGYVVPGLHAFGVPVRDKSGEGFAGICLIGTPEMYGNDHIEEMRSSLLDIASELETHATHCGIQQFSDGFLNE